MCGDRGQGLPVESFTLTNAQSPPTSNSVSVCLCPILPPVVFFIFVISYSYPLHFWLTVYLRVYLFLAPQKVARWLVRDESGDMQYGCHVGGCCLQCPACPEPFTAKLLPCYIHTQTHTHSTDSLTEQRQVYTEYLQDIHSSRCKSCIIM